MATQFEVLQAVDRDGSYSAVSTGLATGGLFEGLERCPRQKSWLRRAFWCSRVRWLRNCRVVVE
jgi:hypothetical protein